jgi:peptidoglycan/LPS O-acetylase OafA/YrhL
VGRKNNDIEVLRAFAIIFTLCAHLRHLIWWEGAWKALAPWIKFWGGVDLFFCISGYVIAGSLLRHPKTNSFSALGAPFWIRRIFRIWPAALAWLAILLVASRFFNLTGAFGHPRANAYGSSAAALQIANFYFMVCGSSVDARWPCGNVDIYWSLSLEEQFYLVFPFLLYFMRPTSLRHLLVLIVIVQLFIPRPPESLLWYVRTDSICLGVLIAVTAQSGRFAEGLARPAGRRAVAALALMLLGMIAAISVIPWLRINAGLLALASAGIVLIASYNANLILPWMGLRPIMLWIGSRSFAIYLLHLPAFAATREIFHRLYPKTSFDDAFAVPMILTAMLLIVILSESTFRFVETPLRNLGRQLATRREILATSPAMRARVDPCATQPTKP